MSTRTRDRKLVPLAGGEIDMIRRALRVWAHCERDAMSSAACARDPVHAADVRRQVLPRIAAAEELMDRLLQDPMLTGTTFRVPVEVQT
jgi:hypothetical protein